MKRIIKYIRGKLHLSNGFTEEEYREKNKQVIRELIAELDALDQRTPIEKASDRAQAAKILKEIKKRQGKSK